MTETKRDDLMLDSLFDAASKDTRAEPSADLMARVLADAEAMQPRADKAPAPDAAGGGWLAGILEVLGGWRPATGLATVALAGAWLGFSATTGTWPAGLDQVFGANTDYYIGYLDAAYAFETEDG